MDTERTGRSVIAVENLEYTYPGGSEPAIEGLDFAVRNGEIFGFLGPSGAGKSTTQNVLTGLLDDYDGSVSVLGDDLQEWGGDYYERIGVSPESPNHYLKLTGRENLDLFGALYEGETADPLALLDRLGLADAADQRVGEYSKGMRMRLNLCRALLHDPDLLFLDEPTTGLDPANARNVKDLIGDLQADGKTIVLTTHDMTVADELADRVAFIVDGHLPVVEAPRTLKLQHGRPLVRVEYRRNGTLESTEVDLDAEGNRELADLLQRESIETIHTEEATLEDVFIAVTGRALS